MNKKTYLDIAQDIAACIFAFLTIIYLSVPLPLFLLNYLNETWTIIFYCLSSLQGIAFLIISGWIINGPFKSVVLEENYFEIKTLFCKKRINYDDVKAVKCCPPILYSFYATITFIAFNQKKDTVLNTEINKRNINTIKSLIARCNCISKIIYLSEEVDRRFLFEFLEKKYKSNKSNINTK